MEANAYQARQPGPAEAPELTTVRILPSADVEADLQIVRAIASVMDEAVTLPGTRLKFGLDSVLGLIPGIGDLGSAAISAYLLRVAARLGVPTVVQLRMLVNIVIDALIGLVPVVGDFLDVLYKANAKNARLILRSVENREATGRSSWFVLVGSLLVLLAVAAGGFVGAVALAKYVWTHVG